MSSRSISLQGLSGRHLCAPPSPDTNPNSPVPGGLLDTTYLVYVDDSGGLYPRLVAFVEEFCEHHKSHAVIWYDGTGESLARSNRAAHRSLPYSRRVLEDPMGYDSSESHLIQMSDLIAHSAHHAVLNDRGIGPADSYLRQHAYLKLLPTDDASGHVWPGGIDGDGFACFAHRLGIRGYPPKAR